MSNVTRCDICKRIITERQDLYSIPFKKARKFVDMRGWQDVDICTFCAKEIKEKVNEQHGKRR